MVDSPFQSFSPDYAVIPGRSLGETLGKWGMTQGELAKRTGLARKTINGIVNGTEPITPDTAIALERVFRVPARFWINLQKNYEEARARLRDQERLIHYRNWIKNEHIPLKELIARQAVPLMEDMRDQLRVVLTFFGVNSPDEYSKIWEKTQAVYNFRKSKTCNAHFGCLAAWLRLGEIAASDLPCEPFRKETFSNVLISIRKKVPGSISECQKWLVNTLAASGVALVYIPGITGAPIYGATRWLSSSKAIVQMSLRGKDDGNFWFTLFHELGHIHLHGEKDIFLEVDKGEPSEKEQEADEFARNRLIPLRQYESFLRFHGGGDLPRKLRFSKDDIVRFAQLVQVSPGVVVGRLQHEGWLPYSHCNELKQPLEFTG